MSDTAVNPANAGIEILVPLLTNYLEAADRDRDATKEVIKELKRAIEGMKECSVDMKLQLKEIETHFEGFDKGYANRIIDCNKKFESLTTQLSAMPSAVELEKREQKLDTLIEKVNNLVIRVYVIMGVSAVLFAVMKWVVPLIFKQ